MPPSRSSELAASGGLWDWDLATNRIHFSPRWFALLGCDEHELGNTREAWLGRVHPDDLALVSDTLDAHLAAGAGEFDIRHRMLHKDGTYRWMSCRGAVRRTADGRVERITGCHADVTATTVADPQSGLPNRLLFMEHVTRSISRAARYEGFHFAVLLIDLGRTVNGTAPPSSLVADPLLAAAARRLESSVRGAESPRSMRHDDLVARLEGDRFGILLCGLKDLGHALVAADRLLGALLAPFPGRDGQVLLSASVGIAVSATGYTNATTSSATPRRRCIGRPSWAADVARCSIPPRCRSRSPGCSSKRSSRARSSAASSPWSTSRSSRSRRAGSSGSRPCCAGTIQCLA